MNSEINKHKEWFEIALPAQWGARRGARRRNKPAGAAFVFIAFAAAAIFGATSCGRDEKRPASLSLKDVVESSTNANLRVLNKE
jgi:hypothetical protein